MRKRGDLSERHIRIMQFLTEFAEERGYSPSIREIGKNIHVDSTSLVDYYLEQLREGGLIERDKRVSRSIRVIKPMYAGQNGQSAVRVSTGWNSSAHHGELLRVPVAGRIGASTPIPMPGTQTSAYFDPESSVEIAASCIGRKEKLEDLFALEVDGVSMIDAMVNDGDIVIMRHAETANNGDMVAVWLTDTDETTLKYFYKENGVVRLQPANPTMKPIIIENPERVRIQGKVVMIVRQMKNND